VTAVVDVCAVMQVLLHKEKASQFISALESADVVVAPDLYVSELANTLWKFHRAKILTESECTDYIESGLNLIDAFVDSKQLWHDAFRFGIKHNHSIYDMLYLALTHMNEVILITDDGDLAKISKIESVNIVF